MHDKLRKIAEERLKKGAAPFTRGGAAGTQALALLHGLASAPDSASDALKLLHELQVHQVELDLQHEQAEQERRQFAEDLGNYAALFDLAPFAYMTLDSKGRVTAANRIAADFLAFKAGEAEEWSGRHIEDLLTPECRSTIQGMLASVHQGKGRQSCTVQSRADGASALAVASAALDGQVLLAFIPLGSVQGA